MGQHFCERLWRTVKYENVFLHLWGPPPIVMWPISPNNAVAGGAAFTLTIHGTNFVAASIVNFGGTARATTFVSAAQLAAAVPAAAIASARQRDGVAHSWASSSSSSMTEPVARGHVEIIISEPARTVRVEVEGCGVAGQCRGSLFIRAIYDRAQVLWLSPRVIRIRVSR